MAELKLENIKKEYDEGPAVVGDFSMDINDGEFIVLVGPSGCGKSTILRMIAGLESVTAGSIYINNKQMNDISPKNRDIAMVFQNYALYPHMSVFDNMAFGLKLEKTPQSEIRKRVREAADTLGLTDYLERKPKALSGGERQRVALGRAIVRQSEVFLMDEPLSNLDAKLRVQMRAEITKLHKRLKTTTIYVTHDQTEALSMASRVVVLDKGEIMQAGTPKEVYDFPENIFVAQFIGSPSMNIFNGLVNGEDIVLGEYKIKIPEADAHILKECGYSNKAVKFGLRPEDIHKEQVSVDPEIAAPFKTTVKVSEMHGSHQVLYAELDGQEFVARIGTRKDVPAGSPTCLTFDMGKAHFFDAATHERIF